MRSTVKELEFQLFLCFSQDRVLIKSIEHRCNDENSHCTVDISFFRRLQPPFLRLLIKSNANDNQVSNPILEDNLFHGL